MIIGGLQKTSFLDYPDKISTIIFTSGCNFRCGYCHNPELINSKTSKYSTEETLEGNDECDKLETDTGVMDQKIEALLAADNNAVNLDFYNDWLNGALYMPLWYWKKTKKKKFFFGLFSKKAVNAFCNCDKKQKTKLMWNCAFLYNKDFEIQDDVHQYKDDKGRWFIGTTKTQTGTRKVHISQTLKIALQNYKNKQDYLKKLYGRKYIYYNLEEVENKYGKIVEHRIIREEISNKDSKRYNLVFTKENGAYIGTDITRYPYKIIHNELGIKKCRFYDLRGSYATKILNNGIEIRDVADLLGHKNIETTENFYISSTESSRKYATELFDNISKSETINKIIEYKIESQ